MSGKMTLFELSFLGISVAPDSFNFLRGTHGGGGANPKPVVPLPFLWTMG